VKFNYKYGGSSSVSNSGTSTGVSFAPDVLRDPCFFVGELNNKIPFREAISALHDVVIADYKFRPKDRELYMEWLASQEPIWLADAMGEGKMLDSEIKIARDALTALRTKGTKLTKQYYEAQTRYFAYLYERDYAAWLVLDPVITVHPDKLFFECFSKDESAYGKLSCNYEVFTKISDFECGTTNIDYSQSLYNEFQKIRSYKATSLKVDPDGFDVKTTGEENYREVKIDLPESWVRGFLQVSSAMNFQHVSFDLHPMDMANFLFVLKRKKETEGPRSIRYQLVPGKPIKAIFEPWGTEVVCRKSIYKGDSEQEIRIWGRRRLALLERLLPIAKNVHVKLLGTGMPSFYLVDLGDMTFTLGLSGWSANDWTSSSQLELLAPKGNVDPKTLQNIYMKLRETWYATDRELANALGLDKATINAALTTFTQAGKVIYDLDNNVYRARELKRDNIDLDALRFSSELEKTGYELHQSGAVSNVGKNDTEKGVRVHGNVSSRYHPNFEFDKDERVISGECTCHFYKQNKLMKGPCEHMVALRFAYDKMKE
jgi:hypothetical protein